jgi:hypothetical protein
MVSIGTPKERERLLFRLLPLGGATTDGLQLFSFAVVSVINPSIFPGFDETTVQQTSLAGQA